MKNEKPQLNFHVASEQDGGGAEQIDPELAQAVQEILDETPGYEDQEEFWWAFLTNVAIRYREISGEAIFSDSQKFENEIFPRMIRKIEKILITHGKKLNKNILGRAIPEMGKRVGQRINRARKAKRDNAQPDLKF